MTSSGAAPGSQHDRLQAGASLPGLVEKGEVLLDGRGRTGDEQVVGASTRAAQGIHVAGRPGQLELPQERRGPQRSPQALVRID
jgi:hypothetical protein